MGKPTGFMEITRRTSTELPPEERIANFNEFHLPLHKDEQQAQGARCMDCGVPFCQSGMMLGGMASGCPLNNLIPEWNDLVYQGQWDLAVKRLIATNRYPEFTSRVCPALCEAACTCGMTTGDAVTVKENERAIVEYGYENGVIHAVPPPARTGKTVAVVGAGPAGLSVADLLNKRGHKVTLYEKSDRLGGVFIAAAAPSFKEKDRELIKWYEKEMKDLGIEIKFNTEVKDTTSLNADEVIVATGSKARILNVPGAEKAIEACDYLLGRKEVGQKVIIIGGGLTGCEIALDMYRKGKTPVIVEMKNDLIAVKGVCLANSSYLRDFFALNNVEVHLDTMLSEVTDKGVIVKAKDGSTFEIEGDTVLISAGYIPTPAFPQDKHVHLVGDCNGVGNLRTVIWRAWDVAMAL